MNNEIVLQSNQNTNGLYTQLRVDALREDYTNGHRLLWYTSKIVVLVLYTYLERIYNQISTICLIVQQSTYIYAWCMSPASTTTWVIIPSNPELICSHKSIYRRLIETFYKLDHAQFRRWQAGCCSSKLFTMQYWAVRHGSHVLWHAFWMQYR